MFKQFFDFVRGVEFGVPKTEEMPVVVCFVMYKGELLLLERSSQVELYKSWWNVVTGYWDGKGSLQQRVKEKLLEELGVSFEGVTSVREGLPYSCRHFVIERDWKLFPVFVELKEKPVIRLGAQHQAFRWVGFDEVKNYAVVPYIMECFDQLPELVA